jgi:hypothetical protein
MNKRKEREREQKIQTEHEKARGVYENTKG